MLIALTVSNSTLAAEESTVDFTPPVHMQGDQPPERRLRSYAQSIEELDLKTDGWLIAQRCARIRLVGAALKIPAIDVNTELTPEQLCMSLVAVTRRQTLTALDLKLAVAYAVDLEAKLNALERRRG